jgi:ATP-dependent exoDNAse (exonuclease V) beta subunit
MSNLTQVAASAGSGKTFELTRRFLYRLTECDESQAMSSVCAALQDRTAFGLSDILAITFTNAAADEMRARILKNLKLAALGESESDFSIPQQKARAQLAVIMRDMNALNIRTIDSLLHLVVRAAALDLNLHPDFQPVFSSEEVLMPYFALLTERTDQGEVTAWLRKACKALVEHGTHKGFLSGESILRPLRGLFDDALRGAFDALSPEADIRNTLSTLKKQTIQAARRFLSEARNLPWKKPALDAVQGLAEGNAEKCDSAYALKQNVAELFRKHAVIPDNVADFFSAYAACAGQCRAQGSVLADALYRIPFVELARALAKIFLANKNQELPAVLIPVYALKALQGEYGVSDMLCRLGTRFRHFLLDEFQDTNAEQWAALHPLIEEALSRNGSLTWVGDVKQSVYGWRGAKPELFDSILNDATLANIAPDSASHTLTCNWRSRSEIIDYNNCFFAPLADNAVARQVLRSFSDDMPEHILAAESRQVSKAFANTRQAYSPKTQRGGLVNIVPLEAAHSEELRALAMEALCDLLRTDLWRRPLSDILVLVRGNNTAGAIAERLAEEGIPVITENSLLLAQHSLIIQLVAFLECMALPEDDPAFWTVITGSIFLEHEETRELSWDTLHDWCAEHGQKPLYLAFSKRWPRIWQRLLEPFYTRAGLMTLYDTVQEWLLRLAVEERFPEARIFLRRFMEVVQNAESKNTISLSDFLQYWHDNSEEKVPMPENMNAVRVMTIHKSKGLEAPVVILPMTNFSVKVDSKPFLKEHNTLRLAVSNTRKLDAHQYYTEFAQNCRENLHLLYVACTRAQEELHIFHTNSDSARTQTLSAAMTVLWQHADIALPYTSGRPEPCDSSQPPQRDALTPPQRQTFFDNWRPMEWLPHLKISSSVDLQPDEQDVL